MATERAPVAGGGFTVARQIFTSDIWRKDPMYLKVWIWILGKASHADHNKNGFEYKRGEFVTTHTDIQKVGMYIKNRQQILPSIKTIRVMLKWLENEGMIHVNPLKPERCRTGADTTAPTRAYIGIKIIVVNYDTYQDIGSYRGRHKGRHLSEQGHYNNNGYNNNDNNTPDFFSLLARYPNQDLVQKAFDAIKSTRKSGKVADSILLSELRRWEKYAVSQVEAGIQIYLEKDYASQGKKESYLAAIIKNQKAETSQPQNEDWMAGAI